MGALSLFADLRWRAIGLVASLLGMAAVTAWVTHRFDLAAISKQEARADKAEARTADLEREVAKVTADALTEQKRQADEFRANNAQARNEYAQSLAAIDADRGRLSGRLFAAHQELARLRALSEAGDRSRADEVAALTGRLREVEQADGELHAACRADAAQLIALQDEIRPQL